MAEQFTRLKKKKNNNKQNNHYQTAIFSLILSLLSLRSTPSEKFLFCIFPQNFDFPKFETIQGFGSFFISCLFPPSTTSMGKANQQVVDVLEGSGIFGVRVFAVRSICRKFLESLISSDNGGRLADEPSVGADPR